MSIGKLVSCQERRALFVTLINGWSNADSVFAGHALHYKGIQRQLSVFT